MSYLIRVVKTSDMPEKVFEYLNINGFIIKDGFSDWNIQSSEECFELYDELNFNEIMVINKWMISQGTKGGERVLIEHD